MATYEYLCKTCGVLYVEVRSMFEDVEPDRCICGGTLVKQYGRMSVTFKGNGFYSTDKKEK